MIRIEKSNRMLYWKNGGEKRAFPISLGTCPVGAKTAEGDNKTPEGTYRVTHINCLSKYHIALGLSYPNARDAKRALSEKRISLPTALRIRLAHTLRIRPPWRTPLGGFIMIHGQHPDGKTGDWTAGCIALSNSDIEFLAAHVKAGEAVEILP